MPATTSGNQRQGETAATQSLSPNRIDLTQPEWIDASQLFDWNWWFQCRINILVVTDGSGSFDRQRGNFGLGKVLDIVGADLWPHVKFQFTTAHRGATAADKQNFTFDTEDLTRYHQIWLFGVNRTGAGISQSELRALAEFMDNGGGVFATGDHEDLGIDLCGEVPRVRSMRRWHHPNPGPNNEPVAPDVSGPGRHDTLTDDPATLIIEASQLDKIPQVIEPKTYSRFYPLGLFGQVATFPHPVLCGPLGKITHLPDHMHEGLIEVPADLTNRFTFDGYRATEYPAVGRWQQRPEVIATATNTVTGGQFGVLGAYDGHRVDVGRVVVDATWHHWFNINMDPYIDASTPGHPNYDPAVVPKWEEIKAYFRNVAAWLAPKGMQRCLRNGGWLYTLGYYDILITHRSLNRVANPLLYYWQLGRFAADALGRFASQCQTTEWLWGIPTFEDLIRLPDPWNPRPQPDPEPGPRPWIDLADLNAIVLGGAVHALAERTGDRNEDVVRALLDDGDQIPEVAAEGMRTAFALAAEQYRESGTWFDR